ncbi:CRISPR-associated ring nuclease Crn1 [Acidianus manzaensis]|uniref:CRISPR-associated protein n=1 Tax=Acidianus manzaensis TaxID=282676 RepID=A0A1W6K3G8_9CREN|nr:CRISPR-associated ring nuclease Crn1 [Acidianus manzaensis]ARM76984.1 hypothetical protein B6F84_00090 [Acidianus manzaensis]
MKLVCTLGMTPGGIAETVINLSTGNYVSKYEPKRVSFDEIIIVRTKDTEYSYAFLKAIFLCCINFGELKEFVLPFNDVSSPQDFIYVRDNVRNMLKAGDYLDFTGGRKAISSAAVLAAREAGAHLVSTIIDQKDYIEMNEKFNELKRLAMSVKGKEDCTNYFCSLISKNSKTILFF